MKKILLIIFLLPLLTEVQSQSFSRGSIITDVGIGTGTYRWFSDTENGRSEAIFFPVNFMVGIHPRIGINTVFQYNRFRMQPTGSAHAINLGIGPAFHLITMDNLLLSTRFIAGYSNMTMPQPEGELQFRAPGVNFQGLVDARYYFTQRVGVTGSLGYGAYHNALRAVFPANFPFRVSGVQALLGISIRNY
ncbi:MAG: hypothetical protein ACK4ND_10205 [Cytophagaceae bacterium]